MNPMRIGEIAVEIASKSEAGQALGKATASFAEEALGLAKAALVGKPQIEALPFDASLGIPITPLERAAAASPDVLRLPPWARSDAIRGLSEHPTAETSVATGAKDGFTVFSGKVAPDVSATSVEFGRRTMAEAPSVTEGEKLLNSAFSGEFVTHATAALSELSMPITELNRGIGAHPGVLREAPWNRALAIRGVTAHLGAQSGLFEEGGISAEHFGDLAPRISPGKVQEITKIMAEAPSVNEGEKAVRAAALMH